MTIKIEKQYDKCGKYMIEKIKKLICKYFGHTASRIDMTILKIKIAAENADQLNKTVKCSRCGAICEFKFD